MPERGDRSDSNVLPAQSGADRGNREPRWGRLITDSLHMSARHCPCSSSSSSCNTHTAAQRMWLLTCMQSEAAPLSCQTASPLTPLWSGSALLRMRRRGSGSCSQLGFITAQHVVFWLCVCPGPAGDAIRRERRAASRREKVLVRVRGKRLLKRSNTGEGDTLTSRMRCHSNHLPICHSFLASPPFPNPTYWCSRSEGEGRGRADKRWEKIHGRRGIRIQMDLRTWREGLDGKGGGPEGKGGGWTCCSGEKTPLGGLKRSRVRIYVHQSEEWNTNCRGMISDSPQALWHLRAATPSDSSPLTGFQSVPQGLKCKPQAPVMTEAQPESKKRPTGCSIGRVLVNY